MNLTVETPLERLAALAKPSLEAATELAVRPEDWLVVCAGFEDRALGALQQAVSTETPINVLVVLYDPFVPENKADAIREVCDRAAVRHAEVTYNRRDPSGFGGTMIDMLTDCRGRIFVDVSAMSRLLIVQAIVALGTRPRGLSDCFITYTEAQAYPPTQAEAEAELAKSVADPTFSILFLSSGVFEITVVPELSSFALAAPQTRLVAFPSLDAHQLTSLRAELQPSRFTFIEGSPPGRHIQWRQEFISKVNHLSKIRDAERCRTSTLNYLETLDCLSKVYSQHSIEERIIISPTGSKMQTVAVGIFRSFIEDVQIVYPTPRSFLAPEQYTLGIGPMHLLPMGRFSNQPVCS
jgi:hypothetical protein